MNQDIAKILYPESAIMSRLDELGAQITEDYQGKDLTVVAILNGSLIFMADLVRRIPLPLQMDCLRVSSYENTTSTGQVNFRQAELPDVRGRNLLLLDDILDTGTTLKAIHDRFSKESGAASIKSCVLLRKKIEEPQAIQAEYVGFDIPNEFVVGYGLDYNENYRHLPYVGVLAPGAIESGKK